MALCVRGSGTLGWVFVALCMWEGAGSSSWGLALGLCVGGRAHPARAQQRCHGHMVRGDRSASSTHVSRRFM